MSNQVNPTGSSLCSNNDLNPLDTCISPLIGWVLFSKESKKILYSFTPARPIKAYLLFVATLSSICITKLSLILTVQYCSAFLTGAIPNQFLSTSGISSRTIVSEAKNTNGHLRKSLHASKEYPGPEPGPIYLSISTYVTLLSG